MDSQISPDLPAEPAAADLLDDLPLAVFVCTADGRLDYLNRAWQRLVGHQPEACLGEPFERFVMEADHGVLRMAIQTLQSRLESSAALGVRLRHASGQSLDTELRLETLPSGQMAGTLYDLTGLARAERLRLERLERRFQQERLESLGQLASGIAHDFNNLLMGVLGNADLALAKLSPFSHGCEHIRGIVTHARRAAELCRQMLAYSGKGNFATESVDLSEVLRRSARLLPDSLPPNVRLETHLEPQLPAVEADAPQIDQLISHLVDNAIEAIGSGEGTVTLRTGAMECSSAQLGHTFPDHDLESGVYVFIEVADDGGGLEESVRTKIFDPFFSTKSGRGLGLTAVLGIVRGHGGTLRVDSEAGKGTAIRVFFPCSTQPVSPRSSDSAPEQSMDSGAGTILVVDDEEIVRSVARGMLELLGYRVLTAADGTEAIEVYEKFRHEIVLVVFDLAMPRMSGEETFLALRELQPDAKVVLSSGYDEQEATQRFTDKGLAGFIQKPYEVAAFSRVINDALKA